MIVGVAQFELFMPYNHSLKEKRQILKKLKDRVAQEMKITVAEVDHQDLWQRASLGFAVVGSDAKLIESLITQTINLVVSLQLGEVSAENRDLIYYE